MYLKHEKLVTSAARPSLQNQRKSLSIGPGRYQLRAQPHSLDDLDDAGDVRDPTEKKKDKSAAASPWAAVDGPGRTM